jgi:tRNA A-37 threonylcarbamoyl transferase component Bud32
MAEFPFRPSFKHVYRKKGLEECLRTNKWYVQIKSVGYRAGFDRSFCGEPEAFDFIERIDTLMDGGQILKSGDTCYVSRVMWNCNDVVVKRYNHKGFIHSVRHTIKGSRALRGWLHGHRLRVLDIPAPKPLAYIEQYKGLLLWESYLVTQYVEGQKLYDFLRDGAVGEGERSKIIEQIAELFERLGTHRITHGDLKHTNILITGRKAVLTDLDGMKVHRFNWTHRIWRAKDIARFLRKTDFSPSLTDYCHKLISGKRSAGGKFSGDFERTRVSDWTIHVRKDFPRRDIVNLILLNGPSAEGRGRFVRVRSSDYTRVYRCGVSFDGVERELYLKRYLYHSVWDFAKRLFRSSRAKSAFKASLMLERGGFDTPCVVGLFERRFGPFRTDNLLLTKEVKGSMKLGAYLSQFCNDTGKQRLQEKRRLIASFGETVGRMHAEGVFHGDLGQGNVLVQEEGSGWRFFFIDNERTKQFHRLPGRMRLKNLVQINMFRRGINNTDRMRFFKFYLKVNPLVVGNRNKWCKKVITKTHLRLERKAKYSDRVEGTCPERT